MAGKFFPLKSLAWITLSFCFVLWGEGKIVCAAFAPLTTGWTRNSKLVSQNSKSIVEDKPLFALTERQMQFWEDVEEGLDRMEKDGIQPQELQRIRKFGKSARGDLPFPKGSLQGHEPSEEHVEGLTARPYWDIMKFPQWFPWAPALQQNIPRIQDELRRVLQSSYSFSSDSAWQNQVMGKGWSAIRLQRLGVWNQEVCTTLFPETYTLIRSLQIPTAVRGVCFARQGPFSGVQPHSDGRNFILTIHVPLQIPTGCWIEVAGDRRTWEEGKLLTVDTSFTHSTSNPTAEERFVLIIDVWHPELTKVEREALEFVYDLRNKYEQGMVPVRAPKSRSSKSKENAWGGLWTSLTWGNVKDTLTSN